MSRLNSPTHRHDPQRAARDALCCQLREQGQTLQQIAVETGYKSASGVSQAIRRGCRAIRRPAATSLSEQQLEDCRYIRERLLPLLQAEPPDLKAAIVLLRASERAARIAGSDAPAKTDATLHVQQQDTGISGQVRQMLNDPVQRVLASMAAERLPGAAPLSKESLTASMRALWSLYEQYPVAPAADEPPKAVVVDAEIIVPPEQLGPPPPQPPAAPLPPVPPVPPVPVYAPAPIEPSPPPPAREYGAVAGRRQA